MKQRHHQNCWTPQLITSISVPFRCQHHCCWVSFKRHVWVPRIQSRPWLQFCIRQLSTWLAIICSLLIFPWVYEVLRLRQPWHNGLPQQHCLALHSGDCYETTRCSCSRGKRTHHNNHRRRRCRMITSMGNPFYHLQHRCCWKIGSVWIYVSFGSCRSRSTHPLGISSNHLVALFLCESLYGSDKSNSTNIFTSLLCSGKWLHWVKEEERFKVWCRHRCNTEAMAIWSIFLCYQLADCLVSFPQL